MKKYQIAFLFISIVIVAFSASAKIYKWTDEKGNVHFSDKPNHQDAKTLTVKTAKGVKSKAKQYDFSSTSTSGAINCNKAGKNALNILKNMSKGTEAYTKLDHPGALQGFIAKCKSELSTSNRKRWQCAQTARGTLELIGTCKFMEG